MINKNYFTISVVLPCYNGQHTLKKCLSSIDNQKCSLELVFVNDGSTDDSLKVFKDYKFRNDITVKVIDRDNKGFLKSLSEAINISQSDLIARIDADDCWHDNHLIDIIEKFKNDKDLVLCGSQCNFFDSNLKYIGKSKLPINHNDIVKYLHKDSPFIHSSVVFKKRAYHKTVGYVIGKDELHTHISDYNLWFELSKLGKCENLSTPSVDYMRLSDSMSRKINKKNNYLIRYRLMLKVNKYYSKHIFYSFFERIKVIARIIQYTVYDFKK